MRLSLMLALLLTIATPVYAQPVMGLNDIEAKKPIVIPDPLPAPQLENPDEPAFVAEPVPTSTKHAVKPVVTSKKAKAAPEMEEQEHLTAKPAAMPVLSIKGAGAKHPLIQALENTYNVNPRIKSEREALKVLDERVSQANAEWRPTITADYSKGRERNSFDGADWAYNDSDIKQLTVTQPIFNGGGTWARTKSAKNLMKFGRQTLKAIQQEVLLSAISAYMDVVQSQAVVELSSNNVDVLGEQQRASEDRFSVGEVTRTDVAQSGARQSRARSDMATAQGDLAAARASFERIVGFKPGILPLPVDNPPVPATLEETKTRALANNPRLKASLFQAKSSEYDVDTQFSALLPQLSLRGNMRREDGAGVSGANQFDTDTVALNLSVPLYQAGSEYSRVRESKRNNQRRRFESMDTTNATLEDATRAWERLQTARATLLSNQSAIDAAEIALEGVKQEQQYGARTTLDVLDAEQELFFARVDLVRSQRNEVVALYNVLVVTGDLEPEKLGLNVEKYDPEENYDKVKWQLIGF